MPQILPAISAAVANFATAVAYTAVAITGSTAVGWAAYGAVTGAAVWLARTAVYYGISRLLSSGKSATVAERQAQILQLRLGEQPREYMFGLDANAGSLVDAFNWGNDYEWETAIIALADHRVHSLVGFYVNGEYHDYVSEGYQPGFYEGSDPRLHITFVNAGWGRNLTPLFGISQRPDRWTSNDRLNGVTFVVVSYYVSDEVWPQGRPLMTFRWVVKGALQYDPRKDSTVPGGSGSHRWGVESTYEWTDNAAICAYNYRRGIWAYPPGGDPQLLVGPGRTAEECPPQDIIAAANICDELVALKAGGSEKRYRASGTIKANERWRSVEQDFAEAMGGAILTRGGALTIEPGAAPSVSATFTDQRLVSGSEIRYQAKLTRDQLINTVVGSFVDPDNAYEETSLPVRRSLTDIAADGEVRELTLPLRFVRSGPQGQRIGEIRRRQARRQRQSAIVLGPRYMRLEAGDRVQWTSDRYLGGSTVDWTIEDGALDTGCKNAVSLREMAAADFAWTAATDELDLSHQRYLSPGAQPAAAIYNFTATLEEVESVSATRAVQFKVAWSGARAKLDTRITGIKIEYREVNSLVSIGYTIADEDSGIAYIPGPVDGIDYEVRAVPIARGYPVVATAWRYCDALMLPPKAPPDLTTFECYQQADGTVFSATAPAWGVPVELEVRAGEFKETGRVVYRGPALTSPAIRDPGPADGSNRYWAGLVAVNEWAETSSEIWRFVDLDVAQLPDRNEFEPIDLQATDWAGVTHGFTRSGVSGAQVLRMDAPGGIRPPYADYFETVDVGTRVKARWFWRPLIAGRDAAPSVPYADLADLSYADLAAWYPFAAADPVSEAQVVSYIATDEAPLDFIDGATIDGVSTAVSGNAALAFTSVSYVDARRHQGGEIDEASRAAWSIAIPAVFRALFDYQPASALGADKILYKAVTAAGEWLRVRYDDAAGSLVCEDSDGGAVSVAAPVWDPDVTYTIALSQNGAERRIAWTYDGAAVVAASGTASAMPAMAYAHLAGAAAISYAELATYSYAELAALSYDDLAGGALNAEGVMADLAVYDAPLTDTILPSIGARGPAGYSEYRTFTPADYIARRASLWLRLNVDPGYGEPVRIDNATMIVDVEDVTETGRANILAAGTRINFAKTYVATTSRPYPEVVTTLTAGATAVSVRVTGSDLFGFTATAYNSAGVAVDASISWAALGPGKGL